MMYYISILLSTLAFGFMTFTRRRVTDPIGFSLDTPLIIQRINDFIPFLYWIFELMIVFFAPTLLQGFFTALIMQLLVNHFIWGTIAGIVERLKSLRK